MATQSVQTVNTVFDKIKIVLAILLIIAGLVCFYFFSAQTTTIRVSILFGSLVLAILLIVFSTPGQDLIAFSKGAVQEVQKVVWPTRKEAMQMTMVVFVFVLLMAIFLWGADKSLEFLFYDLILGWKK